MVPKNPVPPPPYPIIQYPSKSRYPTFFDILRPMPSVSTKNAEKHKKMSSESSKSVPNELKPLRKIMKSVIFKRYGPLGALLLESLIRKYNKKNESRKVHRIRPANSPTFGYNGCVVDGASR